MFGFDPRFALGAQFAVQPLSLGGYGRKLLGLAPDFSPRHVQVGGELIGRLLPGLFKGFMLGIQPAIGNLKGRSPQFGGDLAQGFGDCRWRGFQDRRGRGLPTYLPCLRH